MTIDELQHKLNLLRQEYKLHPSKLLEVRGKLMKYALELKLKKTLPTQHILPLDK